MTSRVLDGWRKLSITTLVVALTFGALWAGRLSGAEAVELTQAVVWAFLAANVGTALTGRISISPKKE